jgi:hypothetical protein
MCVCVCVCVCGWVGVGWGAVEVVNACSFLLLFSDSPNRGGERAQAPKQTAAAHLAVDRVGHRHGGIGERAIRTVKRDSGWHGVERSLHKRVVDVGHDLQTERLERRGEVQ